MNATLIKNSDGLSSIPLASIINSNIQYVAKTLLVSICID